MAMTQTPHRGQSLWGYGAAAVGFGLFGYFLTLLDLVTHGQTLSFGWAWAPELGVAFSFWVDGLSLIFSLLISGIGGLVFLYATGYMGNHPQFGRFCLYLFAFMLSMLGLVLSRDLITLFVFWELTSVTSYLLIGFNSEDAKARRNALQAMLLTGAGGLSLLAGFILIGQVTGTYDLATILSGQGLQDQPYYLGILILVLLGAFTKSAQVPFHFWLPNAMSAPTPVSAYLHSATMVKAGVFLLARLHPTLSGTPVWEITLTSAGLITAVWASIIAFRQTDLKQTLAYTTLMALGTITLFLASSTPYAVTAAITFLIVHSLYKAAMFMVVGSIDHGAGTRDVEQLGSLRHLMPITATATLLAGASMAGLPPFFGWIGKELIYTAATVPTINLIIVIGLLAANALMAAIAAVIAIKPFWSTAPKKYAAKMAKAHEAPWQMLLGPVLLAVAGVYFGINSHSLQPILDATVKSSLHIDHAAQLHLWAGLNLALILSVATFVIAVGLYLSAKHYREKIGAILDTIPKLDNGWDHFLSGFKHFAAWQTKLIQNGKASYYLTLTFLTLSVVFIATLWARPPSVLISFDAPWLVWLVCVIGIAGSIFAVFIQSRIAVITAIGTIGISVSILFVVFAAPDVATTQLMVETLSAIIFGIALLRLPKTIETRKLAKKILHAILAIAIGSTVTIVILAITSHDLDRHITTYYEANAYLMAHGRNIVNVILVDFRAFDTFGELTVILLASIGSIALLKRKDPKNEERK